MTVRDLLAMNIDIDVYDADTEKIGIAYCGPTGLTEAGKEYFKDVLDYEVEFVNGTRLGDIALVHIPDNVNFKKMLQKTTELFYSLAGYCPQSDWDDWFYWLSDDEEEKAMTKEQYEKNQVKEVKKMTEERSNELLINHVVHLEECCSNRKEAVYCLLNCLGWTREELIALGFDYLFEEDEENE